MGIFTRWPKSNRSNQPDEFVDIRVLKAVYEVAEDAKVLVGQQFDVFIQSEE